jgi:hypothetical protein
MSYLDDLLAGGPGYSVKPTSGGATFKPVDGSDEALRRFQPVAAEIIENEGDDYEIFGRPHRSSDRPGNFIDLLVIAYD